MTADSGPWRGSVLVVDDDMVSNVVSRLVLAHMLRRMGFEVLEADDVGPAIEMVAGSDFSIVFCDFSMPGGTGLDVLARLAVKIQGGRLSPTTDTPAAKAQPAARAENDRFRNPLVNGDPDAQASHSDCRGHSLRYSSLHYSSLHYSSLGYS